MPSSRVQIAELAGVSRQAVHKAIRAGHLVQGSDGLIDPEEPQNAQWLLLHQRGFDARVRSLDTYRWAERAAERPVMTRPAPRSREERERPRQPELVELGSDRMTDAEIEALLRPQDDGGAIRFDTNVDELLAGFDIDEISRGSVDAVPEGEATLFENWSELPIDPERADALLKPIRQAGGCTIALICAMLEGLRAEVARHLEAHRQATLDIRRRVDELAEILTSREKSPTSAAGARSARGLRL